MSGPRFFKKTPRAGFPLSLKGLAKGLANMERALSMMSVHNGRVDWHGYEPKIVLDTETSEAVGDFWKLGDDYLSCYGTSIGAWLRCVNVRH